MQVRHIIEERSELRRRALIANAGRRGRPIAPLVLSAEERAYLVAIAKAALANGPQNTRQLFQAVLKAKGLYPGDRVLAKAISHRLIHALRIQARNGKLVAVGRQKAARIWRRADKLV